MLAKKHSTSHILAYLSEEMGEPGKAFPALTRVSELKSAGGHHFLASGFEALDHFLDGGLRFGELCEWGAPMGRGGRDVILRFLSQRALSRESTPSSQWNLWVCGKENVEIYPPAWLARGVDLKRVRFCYSNDPIHDLKALFFNPFFRVIVLDAHKKLKNEDCAFLAQRARANHQIIILVRDYFLTPKRGNVWARLRMNSWQDEDERRFHVSITKGLTPRQMSFGGELIN